MRSMISAMIQKYRMIQIQKYDIQKYRIEKITLIIKNKVQID